MPEQTTAYVHKEGPAHVSAFGLDKTPAGQQAAIADLGAAPTAADYNTLLALLRTFGFIAS